MAVAGLGEIVGALGASIAKRIPELLNTFMKTIHDESVEVQSNSIYAMGLLLEIAPQDLSTYSLI
jgi:hypothetical protein